MNGLTVMRAFGAWLAPTPSVEFAGLTKSTWNSQPFTWVKVVGLLAGLSMARRNSALPAGGGEPVRKVAGTRLQASPRVAGEIVKATAPGLGAPVPLIIALRSSA